MSDATPTSLNCPACGAPLDYDGTSTVLRCKFCGNVSILPGGLIEGASAPAAALDEIRRLAKGGNLLEAIKKYRRVYGVDLKEAREAVEALQAGRLAAPSAPGMPSADELTRVIQEVQRLIGEGKKIEAIKVYRENYDVSATRASYAIEQIEAGQTLHPESGFDSFHATEPVSTGRSPRWLGWVIALGIFVLVGTILALTLLQPGGPFKPHYFANDKAALLNSNSNASPDLALWLYDPQAENRFIGLLSGENGKLAWKAAPLAGDGFIDALVSGPEMIYAVNGTDLLAYRRTDGTLAWQARLTDKLNYTDSALLLTTSRVIVNTADEGTLKKSTSTALETDVNVIGAGRENLLAAVGAKVALDPVSVSFGAVPSGSGQTRTFAVQVTDLTGAGGTYAVTVGAGGGGVAYSVSPSTVSIGANGTATVTVTMAAAKGAAVGGHQARLAIGGASPVAHAAVFTLVK